MNRPYEEQLKHWAAKRFNLNVEKVKSVNIETDHDYDYSRGCQTCDYGRGECDLYYSVRIELFKKARQYHTINFSEISFGELIQEIVNA